MSLDSHLDSGQQVINHANQTLDTSLTSHEINLGREVRLISFQLWKVSIQSALKTQKIKSLTCHNQRLKKENEFLFLNNQRLHQKVMHLLERDKINAMVSKESHNIINVAKRCVIEQRNSMGQEQNNREPIKGIEIVGEMAYPKHMLIKLINQKMKSR